MRVIRLKAEGRRAATDWSLLSEEMGDLVESASLRARWVARLQGGNAGLDAAVNHGLVVGVARLDCVTYSASLLW
jgi:hypothetical protein